MAEGRGGERKREWMDMVSGQNSNLECISFMKLFLTMAAGSCFPVLTGCPIISCAFSTHFSFSLAYSQSPLRIINMRAFLGGLTCRSFYTLSLNSIIKGEGTRKQDCWVLRMTLNLQAHFAARVYLAEPGSCLANLSSKSMPGKILQFLFCCQLGPRALCVRAHSMSAASCSEKTRHFLDKELQFPELQKATKEGGRTLKHMGKNCKVFFIYSSVKCFMLSEINFFLESFGA